MAILSSNPFNISVVPRSAMAASFRLTSAVGGTDLPFTLGHAFKKGDVPAGASVTGNLANLQVVGKNYWPDGSLRFAIIAGRATLAAGVAQTVTLRVGASSGGAALTTDDLRATGAAAAVGAAGFGTASWSGADWSAPFQSWIAGPQMSSWIYRKPIGSDPHLVAWLEVRLYAGGAVEVLPWIENGYLNVAAPTNKSAVYTFTLGSTQRFSGTIDLPHHCRTVLVAGADPSHWLGNSPRITPNHDKAYLQATRMVPAYSAAVPASADIWSTLSQSYTPLQKGNYSGEMGQGGYQPAIGLLPEWDVLYLTSDDARAYAGVITNAYGAGRFPTHFRDETTQRPLRFSSYPYLVVNGAAGVANSGASTKGSYTPTPSGTVPPTYDSPHHPSMGYFAYLLTGRYYFMEEVQFVATTNFLKNTDWVRQSSAGVFVSNVGANTVRGAAWSLRTLAHALCITPDSDPLRAEFLASMTANVEFYHGTYVAKPNNPFGIVAPYGSYGSGVLTEAPWQQDFFTAVTGYAIDLDLGMSAVSQSKLVAFFAWKAQSIIGRLGTTAASDYLYCDAGQYTLAVAPSTTADYANGTGPWYANWGEIYAATVGSKNPGVDGPLRGGNFPEATSYWGNLLPAIVFAVQHKVPGALAAYQRLQNASNWSSLAAGLNSAPVWSVALHNT